MTYIMAVDDDQSVLNMIQQQLGRIPGFEIQTINDSRQVFGALETRLPDVMILDVSMPSIDGITLARRLRRDQRYAVLPILILSAHRETTDIVRGLDAGADDYLVKPFDSVELSARLTALLRRAARNQDTDAQTKLEDIKLDSTNHTVQMSGVTVQLTVTEHRLLRYMMRHANQALSPSHLLEAVWDYVPNTGDPDLVRAHMRNLRKKFRQAQFPKLIRTVHGVGYMVSRQETATSEA